MKILSPKGSIVLLIVLITFVLKGQQSLLWLFTDRVVMIKPF